MTLNSVSRNFAASPRSSATLAAGALALLSATAAAFVYRQGWPLDYGDAEAHLNIARRIVDSRLPGYHQFGTVWLPLPHLLMLAFVRHDALWRSGLGGILPSAAAFAGAGLFLFLAVRRLTASLAAALAAVSVFALNPNLLYLQSTPMTESLALFCTLGLFYFCVRFHGARMLSAAAWAGFLACCGTLTRYDAWFLLPFAALFFLWRGGWRSAILFSVIAAAGPLFWLAHNAYLYSDPLEFYRGEWSARAIYARSLARGMAPYPGDHDWARALLYYCEAARLCAGTPLFWAGLAGAVMALLGRFRWAALFLALTPAFYVLSLYSSGTPIYVPHLWPHSHYNIRYGIALLPLAAFGCAALVALAPARLRPAAALLLLVAASVPWIRNREPGAWICWEEARVNSAARRAWTRAATAYLAPRYRPGDGILISFGDITGILREARIPIREALHEGDLTLFEASLARPDLFLWQEWAIASSGDRVSRALNGLRRGSRRYECVRIYSSKDSPAIEIWRHIQ